MLISILSLGHTPQEISTMTHPSLITDAPAALIFAFGGRARFTLVSKQTGKRYTYRVAKAKDADMFFASLLVGQNNEADYEYLGFVKAAPALTGHAALIPGKKGNPAHPAYKALDWTLRHIGQGNMPEALEFWHEGRCARCGRALTDPASIEAGFGPECINHI
jgi:hypothetical protein